MKVGLIDVDGHNFPNLALMKISASHKAAGDQVEWWNGLCQYDIVYKAKVFDSSLTNDEEHCIMADTVIQGGTGYDLKNTLPYEIEHIYPDYSIYDESRAIGFLTRGCPRGCGFCIVAEKEGLKSHQVADLDEFYSGQKDIVLLDPNITGAKECEALFEKLVETKKRIDFNQGLDIRLLTDKGADQLNRMRTSMIHFAWDNYEMRTYEKLKYFRPMFEKKGRNLTVYILTNYNTTHEQDLERIYKMRELDYTPFVMIYDRRNAPKITKKMARWVNNRFVWQSVPRFEDYDPSIG